MEVAGSGDGLGDDNACCVDCLPGVGEVYSASDLLDQDWSQSLGSELLVNTQVVDFSHVDLLVIDHSLHRYPRDKSKEFLGLSCSHSNMPLLSVPRHQQSPSEELNGIVKSECVSLILHIVLHQQLVQFLYLLIILQVQTGELETGRQIIRLLFDRFYVTLLDLTFLVLNMGKHNIKK